MDMFLCGGPCDGQIVLLYYTCSTENDQVPDQKIYSWITLTLRRLSLDIFFGEVSFGTRVNP